MPGECWIVFATAVPMRELWGLATAQLPEEVAKLLREYAAVLPASKVVTSEKWGALLAA